MFDILLCAYSEKEGEQVYSDWEQNQASLFPFLRFLTRGNSLEKVDAVTDPTKSTVERISC